MIRGLLERAQNHDDNEERHYLKENGRIRVAWSWQWLAWGLAAYVGIETWGEERGGAWVTIGPLTVEAFVPRKVA